MPHLRANLQSLVAGPVQHENCRDAATLLHLSDDSSARKSELEWLVRWLSPTTPDSEKMRAPLREVLELADSNGCRTIVVEHDYVDHDWQSEHETFWVSRHERRPEEVPRLHFFACRLQADQLHNLPAGTTYIGFSVLRPVPMGPVGRTVLKRPPWLENAVLCTVTEHPTLFGTALEVTGVPFIQQDAELLSCAHAAVWQAHYVAQSHALIPRRWTAEIVRLASGQGHPRRAEGLTAEQMRSALACLGLPTIFWDVSDLPALPALLPDELHGSWSEFEDQLEKRVAQDEEVAPGTASLQEFYRVAQEHDFVAPGIYREQLLRSLCRSVNSGFPAVVLTDADGALHAINVVGWIRRDDLPAERRPTSRLAINVEADGIVLVVCDDQTGPYELVVDPLVDRRGQWFMLFLPALERIELSGEAAEERAFRHVDVSARVMAAHQANPQAPEPDGHDRDLSQLVEQVSHLRGPISVRVQLIEGRALKAALLSQGRGDDAARVYRLARLPKWVWVAEFQDRALRGMGKPCVRAELVLDATSPDSVPITLLSCTPSLAKDAARLLAGDSLDVATGAGPGEPWRRLRDVLGAGSDAFVQSLRGAA